jgi:hypothetical protein
MTQRTFTEFPEITETSDPRYLRHENQRMPG